MVVFKFSKFPTEMVGGLVGCTALSYHKLRSFKNPANIDLFDLTISSLIGYVIGSSLPVLTPVLVVGVLYEDYHRNKTNKNNITKNEMNVTDNKC